MKTALTTEQSARLIELGVEHPDAWINEIARDINGDKFTPRVNDRIFSLSQLLCILPKKITYNTLTYTPNIWVDETGAWNVEYITLNGIFDDMGSSVRAEELIDAVYQEICFLKEEKIKEL